MYWITPYSAEWLDYNELETMWKEIGCGLNQGTSTPLTWRDLKPHEKTEGSRCPGRGSNPAPRATAKNSTGETRFMQLQLSTEEIATAVSHELSSTNPVVT